MANTITKKVILSGTKYYAITWTITGDGSGDQVATLFNVTTGDMNIDNKLLRIWADLTGFSAQLLWKATANVLAQQIPSDMHVYSKYDIFGGIPNAGGTGVNGDLLITTNGLGVGDTGVITLLMKIQ